VRWTFGLVRCRFGDDSQDVVGLFDCTDVFRLPAAAVAQDDES